MPEKIAIYQQRTGEKRIVSVLGKIDLVAAGKIQAGKEAKSTAHNGCFL
jgi:hypothetical protein